MIPLATSIAAVIALVGAVMFHRGSASWMKWVATVVAFGCGVAITQTTFGVWISMIGPVFGVICAGALLLVVLLLIRDLADKRPDRTAFWCAFALPILVMVGVAHVQALAQMASDGTGDLLARLATLGG